MSSVLNTAKHFNKSFWCGTPINWTKMLYIYPMNEKQSLYSTQYRRELSHLFKMIYPGTLNSAIEQMRTMSLNRPLFVWTLNLSHLRLVRDFNLKFDFLEAGCLVVADGWPIKFLSRMILGRKVNRITGVDLVEGILRTGMSFGIIGSSKSQVHTTLSRIDTNVSKNLCFVIDANFHDYRNFDLDEVGHLLSQTKPQVVFVALGFPKQEFLYEKMLNSELLTDGAYLGIGGSFQILSGEKIRAPKYLQLLGLEWLWRAVQDPARLIPRYFLDFIYFVLLVISEIIKKISSSGIFYKY
jgi:N-acetylglucosaminyldiphosphoundecaprenol N-acetyl-beta-D-mannosaminyltransferase